MRVTGGAYLAINVRRGDVKELRAGIYIGLRFVMGLPSLEVVAQHFNDKLSIGLDAEDRPLFLNDHIATGISDFVTEPVADGVGHEV